MEKIIILLPDHEEIDVVEHTEIGDRVLFKVPKLVTYDLTLVQLK